MSEYWQESSRKWTGMIQDLFGVPNSPFKTRGELVLSQQEDIRLALQGIERSIRTSSDREESRPSLKSNFPEIRFDTDIITHELSGGFERLVGEQAKLQEITWKLGLIWMRTLEEHQLSNRMLEALWQQGVQAFEQRNAALNSLIREFENVGTNMTRIQGAVEEVGFEVSETRDALLRSILELGIGISQMESEEVKTRFHIVETLKGFERTYLWSQRERAAALRHMADQQKLATEILKNPRAHASEEEWKIAELCRIAGDALEAKKMLMASLETNPANPKPMFSMGMEALRESDSKAAIEWFQKASKYAKSCGFNELAAFSELHSAKVGRFENDLDMSRSRLENALKLDVRNFESWYEAAIISMLTGIPEDAKEALYVLIRYSSEYRLKILWDPLFYPMQTFIHETIRKYS